MSLPSWRTQLILHWESAYYGQHRAELRNPLHTQSIGSLCIGLTCGVERRGASIRRLRSGNVGCFACMVSFFHQLAEELLQEFVLALELLKGCYTCGDAVRFWSKQFQLRVLVPRHKQACDLVEDVTEKVISSQGTCIITHAHPRFELLRNHQFTKASCLDDKRAFIQTPAHICP